MALFPMTFPFYFEEVTVYPPFRPLTDESGRVFGTIPEDPRMFLDPSFAPRLPEIATFRPFDDISIGRQFGLIADIERDFDEASSSSRVFGITPPVSRPFDDDTNTGRS